MILVGCDLHTRKQQVAVLDTDTGEVVEQELAHTGDAVEQFYATLLPSVTVGIESTGYSLGFHTLRLPLIRPVGSRRSPEIGDAAHRREATPFRIPAAGSRRPIR